MLNLDTHIILFSLADELTPRERKLLSNDQWSISSIVIWEIAKLSMLGRIELDLDHLELTRLLSGIQTFPITVDVCRAIRTLDFRSDPADEIIAATSIVNGIPLVTRDARLRKSKIVPLAND
ncbi:MAG TPA: type II toxin-antitoxin system VapC family toxin [Tepidisphaeraceae bacterium]|nr:type II toxin-antitoxin system VapC family toxin [Tepidisphaeraceae bacterium]